MMEPLQDVVAVCLYILVAACAIAGSMGAMLALLWGIYELGARMGVW